MRLRQTCDSGADLNAGTKSAIESAAQRYFSMSAQGDVAGLKANAIPDVAANFTGIEQAVVDNKKYFAEGQPVVAGTYLLDASQSKGTLQRADFYCGIYNSPERVGFSIPNLPAGRYAVVIQKISGDKNPITLTMILQDSAGAWKLAGYYPRLNAIGGHDGEWYLAQARQYKAKNQLHNAWFYYLTAWDLLAPVNFMAIRNSTRSPRKWKRRGRATCPRLNRRWIYRRTERFLKSPSLRRFLSATT